MTTRTAGLRVLALICAAAVGALTAVAAEHAAPTDRKVLTSIDVGFAQDMTVHHQQAVTMSDMVVQNASPEVLALADEIRFAQLREIGIMTGWLQVADEPLISSQPMAWMHEPTSSEHVTDMPMAMPNNAPETRMPGLASPHDLQLLQRATGRANETLFLQLMTRHHQGGIAMAAYVITHTHTQAVHDTAMYMVNEQLQELQLMSALLQDHGAAPLPYP